MKVKRFTTLQKNILIYILVLFHFCVTIKCYNTLSNYILIRNIYICVYKIILVYVSKYW